MPDRVTHDLRKFFGTSVTAQGAQYGISDEDVATRLGQKDARMLITTYALPSPPRETGERVRRTLDGLWTAGAQGVGRK